MSFILDALRKVEYEKITKPVALDIKTKMFEVGNSGLSIKIAMIIAGAAALALSSAVAWGTILYMDDPKTQEHSLSPEVTAVEKTVRSASVSLNTNPQGKIGMEKEEPLQVSPSTFTNSGRKGYGLYSGSAGMEYDGKNAGEWEEDVLDEPLKAELKAEISGAEHRIGSDGKKTISPALDITYEGRGGPEPAEPPETVAALTSTSDAGRAAYVSAPRPATKTPPMEEEERVAHQRPEFVLEGIVFHSNPESRSAMIRKKGRRMGELVKIGDTIEQFEVARIEPSSVVLTGGGEEVTLNMDE